MKKNNDWIKNRVQAIEKKIPLELEDRITSNLNRTGKTKKARTIRSPYSSARRIAIAAVSAACTLLIILVLTSNMKDAYQRTDQVMIKTAKVEGTPAQTYIIQSRDPEMRIIWFEKTHQE